MEGNSTETIPLARRMMGTYLGDRKRTLDVLVRRAETARTGRCKSGIDA